MIFPVYIHLGPLEIHPHLFFETLAYTIGFRAYLVARKRSHDIIPMQTRYYVLAGAVLGAAIGSKLLHWFYDPRETLAHLTDWRFLLGGKTIVGGLLGGLLGVELAKKIAGETRSTGDIYVLPLCLGMAMGRVGCFLSGLADLTYGVQTSLPWGIDLGDGVLRHPTSLYEILMLGLIAVWAWRRKPVRSGDTFIGFLILYLSYRLLIDPLKPEPRVLWGLSAIQVACVAGLVYYGRHIKRVFFERRAPERDA